MAASVSFAFACLLLVGLQRSSVDGGTAERTTNKEHIERQQTILEEAVKDDLITVKEKFNTLVNETKEAMKHLRSYAEKALIELKDNVDENIKNSDSTINNSTLKFDSYASDMFEEMNETMLENLDSLSSASAQERSEIIDWSHKRNHHNEDILKSSIALCVSDQAQSGAPGQVITYNSQRGGYVENKVSWRVLNTTAPDGCCINQGPNYCEDCAMKVLNRVTGEFTVPNNASGLFMFTFTVNMDTYTKNEGPQPAEYQFRKNKHLIPGTKIFSNVGSNRDDDRAPGSKTIFLDLNVGDKIDVVTMKTILDVQITFCGVLLHLNQVSR